MGQGQARPGRWLTSRPSLAWPTAGQSRAVASMESLSYSFNGAGTEGPKSWNGVLDHGQVGENPRGRQGHWCPQGPDTPLISKVTYFQEHFFFDTTTSSQAHQPLVFPVSMVYTQKHSVSCNHGCILCLITNGKTHTCHFSLAQVLP